MNTNVRFSGYAVRREFRRGQRFYGALPPKDAPAQPPRVNKYTGKPVRHSGENAPYRKYCQYNLLYRVATSSSQTPWRPIPWNNSDTAIFMAKRGRLRGYKQMINRTYRRSFKQQLTAGLEASSEFRVPQKIHFLNCTW